MVNHSCDNDTCKTLNPYLERLLTYQDLSDRITKVEDIYYSHLRDKDRFTRSPMDLFVWCNEHRVWQLINLEFIQELASKIREIDPKTILEVGAGRGLLGKYLGKELNRKVIITDDYSWWKCGRMGDDESVISGAVTKTDYKEAVRRYNPDLIIASWIPHGREWVKYFREHESVNGCIVIGEPRGGCTGDDSDWDTSWKIECLSNVEKFGLCCNDHGFCHGHPILHTDVTYFQRPLEG